MLALVEELKHRYPSRIVIFDLPPLLHTADVLAFSPYTDALLFVVEEGKTTAEAVAARLDAGKELTSCVGDGIEQGWANGRNPCEHEEAILPLARYHEAGKRTLNVRVVLQSSD